MLTTLTLLNTTEKVDIDISAHLGLAHKVAKAFADKRIPVKDSEEYSVAILRLVQVAKNYGPLDSSFARFACRQMQQAIIDFYRHRQRRKRKGKFEDVDLNAVPQCIKHEPLPEELLYKFLADHPDDTAMDRADKLLLVEFYLGGNKIADIAERLCVSRVTIYDRIKRCISKIRQRYTSLIERYEGAFHDD